MEKRICVFLLISLAMLGLGTSCQKQIDKGADALYINDAYKNFFRKAVVDKYDVGFELAVTSTYDAGKDLNASLVVDEDFLKKINKEYNAEYELLPDSLYTLSDPNLLLKKGNLVSNPLKVKIHANPSEAYEGKEYVLPLTLKSDEKLLTSSKSVLYQILKVREISAMETKGWNASVDFKKGTLDSVKLKNLKQLTYETLVRVNKFAPQDANISTLMGMEGHFLFRFGDAAVPKDEMQFAGFQPELKAAGFTFTEKSWHHVAAVVDCVEKVTMVYVDGKLIAAQELLSTAYKDDAGDYVVNLLHSKQGMFALCRSYNAKRGLDGTIAETRVWSVARTEQEINRFMYSVPPKSEGLVAYWRFNEETGTDIKDHTGHGYDITGSGKWISGLKVPFLGQ